MDPQDPPGPRPARAPADDALSCEPIFCFREYIRQIRQDCQDVTENTDKHAPVHCPRCGAQFQCKVNTPSRCDCMEVPLTPDEMEYILLLSDGECLCPRCLEQMRADYRLTHGF
ncbi:MAG: cysteine-rich CWC family protein [Chloroherpetonaceae bacterium]|nr:cysteine-rich CWC family protein [Chthonomonadaceae bacterium]MDW8208494.1 cysteine-rich CWC family protein [Chloroherpetonaceae bacterium]